MANRLSKEKSPYLLQHADNPVDWHPWSEEAFVKAAAEDKTTKDHAAVDNLEDENGGQELARVA